MSCNSVDDLYACDLYVSVCITVSYIYSQYSGIGAAMTLKLRKFGDVMKTIKTVFTMHPDCDYYILYIPNVGQVCEYRRRSHLSQHLYICIYHHRRSLKFHLIFVVLDLRNGYFYKYFINLPTFRIYFRYIDQWLLRIKNCYTAIK